MYGKNERFISIGSLATDEMPQSIGADVQPVTYTTFVVDEGREAESVEEAFDFVAEYRERRFIVACQMECIMEVFRQVCVRRYYDIYDIYDIYGIYSKQHLWLT